jgi:sugar lactone lactonase YvrE
VRFRSVIGRIAKEKFLNFEKDEDWFKICRGPPLESCRRLVIIVCFINVAALTTLAQVTDETPAKKTAINGPSSLALDNQGHLFVIEGMKDRVRRVDLRKGTIKTVAGNGKECCYVDGKPAVQVSLHYLNSIAVDTQGNLFIGDGGQVRRVDARTGLISTVAGNGKTGETAEGSSALSVTFWNIDGLGVDQEGDLFIADGRQGKIFRIAFADRVVSKVAGNGKVGFSGDTALAVDASFFNLGSIALDSAGNIFVTDSAYCRIRRIDHKTRIIDTIAQTGGPEQNCPPQPHVIPWSPAPSDPAVDSKGDVYFVQGSLDIVSRVGFSPENNPIVAGNGKRGFSGDGGVATAAMLSNPAGLAVDSEGNLYISEYVNNRIRRVDSKTKIIITVAGNGLPHRLDVEM